LLDTIGAHTFRIFTNASERVRIDSVGNVGIGTTTPYGKLHVVTSDDTAPNTVTGWGSRHAVFGQGGPSGGGVGISYNNTGGYGIINALSPSVSWRNLILQSGAGNVGIGTTAPTQLLHVNGTAYATTFLHTSDRRLKTDINPIATAVELTTKLRGVHFKWKKDGVPAYGVIAQEVEAVMPDAVTTNSDGTKAVDYDQLIPVLIEAVKALRVEVDALKRERPQ
ncbi:MAG: tail fiber domain-containing protein, partial [Hyphomicrobium sp.]